MGIHLKASDTSFFAKRIGIPGKRSFHQRMALATSWCLGCNAGGCLDLWQLLLMGVASQMTLPFSETVRLGNIFGTLARGTEMTPSSSPLPGSSRVISARPLVASFHNCCAASSRCSRRLGCGADFTLRVWSMSACALTPNKAVSLALASTAGWTNPSKKPSCNLSKWSPCNSIYLLRRLRSDSFHPPAAFKTSLPLAAASPKAAFVNGCCKHPR